MRFNRFTLAAALLALGVAACGDDVEIVQPTPEPPPPPPPVTATMAPASASVAVGNSVVFAVNASGGVAGDAASWTCASSNTGIATVTSTSAGCSATGVAAGDVTITASVSKSGETVNVGAQLTVTSDELPPQPPGNPAFILIQAITGDGGTDVNGLKRRVTVQIGVERGDQQLEELALLVDGAVVASQSFGGGMDMMAPADDGAAEQAVHEFWIAFDSHKHDPDTGVPVYPNGEHTISAELEVGVTMADGMHGHETISSNTVPVEFDNDNRYELTIATDGNRAMDSDGLMWNSGAVTARVLPVIYTGETIAQVTLGLRHAADGSVVRTSRDDGDETLDRDEIVASITDEEAPFEVTWANERASGSDQKRVGGIEPAPIVVHMVSSAYSDGTEGPTETPIGDDATVDKPYFMRLDNKGPTIGDFHLAVKPNRHYPISRWAGAGYAFTFSSSSRTADFSDGGVGRNWADYEYSAGPSTDNVSAVATADDLAATFSNSAYVLNATVRDLLGNETTRWWAGFDAEADCTPGDDATEMEIEAFEVPDHCVGIANSAGDRETVDATAGFKFGVDLTAPTQELLGADDGDYLVDGGVIQNVASGTTVNEAFLVYRDALGGSGSAPSGFPTNPVHTRITLESPDLQTARAACLVGWHSSTRRCQVAGDASSSVGPGSDGRYDFASGANGYYFLEYAAMDNAGNTAEPTNLRGILDTSPPAAVVSFAPPVESGEAKTFSISAFDNLDLQRADGYLLFNESLGDGTRTHAIQQTSQIIGGFGTPFEQNAAAPSQIVVTGTLNVSGTMQAAEAYGVRVYDQGGNSIDATSSATFGISVPTAASFTGFAVADAGLTSVDRRGSTTAVTTLCWDVDDDGCGTTPTRSVLQLEATGPAGTVAVAGVDANNDGDFDDAGDTAPVAAVPATTADPFTTGVRFYVRRSDAGATNNTLDGAAAWMLLPANGTLIVTPATPNTDAATFRWSAGVAVAELAAAAALPADAVAAAGTTVTVDVRAVGYDANGNAMTHTTAVAITVNPD